MRKVEEDMLMAVRSRRSWAGGNTHVSERNGRMEVFLHGNHIADVLGDGQVIVDKETYRSWPTPTTTSRLRALGANVHVKDFEPHVDGEPI